MATAIRHMLTTVDNPYSPYTQWDEWFEYDTSHGYHTNGLLARITITSDELSDADQLLAQEIAIDEIVKEDVLGLYKKVAVDTVETSDPALLQLQGSSS
jgi:hypothetical protein